MRRLIPLLLLVFVGCGSDDGGGTEDGGLKGQGYRADITTGTFAAPAGIGDTLQNFVNREILISVVSDQGGELGLMGALTEADATGQAACLPTIHLPIANYSDAPNFSLGPVTTTLPVGRLMLPVEGLVVEGTFAEDGSRIEAMRIAGRADTRPMVPLISEDGEETMVCDLAEASGVTCVACAAGGVFCIDFEITDLAAAGDTEVLQPRHTPATASPASDSTNVCDGDACSAEAVCSE